MDWGIEIWDQFENVDRHLHHGIEYSDRYMKFVQERSSIEQDYAKQLRRLVKKYQPKKKDDECGIFSTHKAFQSQLSELNDIAGQHEVVAESLMKSVVKTLQAFVTEMRAEKKKSYQEGRHLQAQLDSFERALEQTKRKFEKEWRESERATANYEKLDADVNVTKAEVDKARQASIAKKDSVESCKGDYASMLTKFNQEQREHFHTHMPKVFENFRDMEERRIYKLSEMMGEFATIDTNVKPIVSKCLEGMKRAAEAVDANLDSKLVVEKFKSGFYPPNDKEFEDYTVPQQHLTANEDDKHLNSPRNSMNLAKSKDKKGLSWLFGGKKNPESADYSHLPPEQRKKKLQKHIDELRGQHAKEIDGRNAILKMQDVYRANPAMGDAGSLEMQLKNSNESIAKLEADLNQYETWYAEASGGAPPRPAPAGGSVHQQQPQQSPNKPQYTQPLKSGPTQKKPSLQHEESFADEFEEDGEAVGSCVALFDFSANSEGAMSMKEGDKFTVLEADKGDGWTRVMKDNADGYVPTSYLEVQFY